MDLEEIIRIKETEGKAIEVVTIIIIEAIEEDTKIIMIEVAMIEMNDQIIMNQSPEEKGRIIREWIIDKIIDKIIGKIIDKIIDSKIGKMIISRIIEVEIDKIIEVETDRIIEVETDRIIEEGTDHIIIEEATDRNM